LIHVGLYLMLLQLALEEEDVWRAVLSWAKYQAGVTQPTAHWTEEERVRVCQHLAGVIGHVRLLLIGMWTAVTLILYWPGMTLPGRAFVMH